MKIRNKLIGTFLLLAILPITIAGVLGIRESVKLLADNTVSHLEVELFSKAEAIRKFVKQVQGDVLYLKENLNLKRYLETGDPVHLQGLEQDFLSFSETHPYYYQIRYIDAQGYERVRVDSDGVRSFVIPKEKLQLKRNRYYFRDTMEHPPDSVYVSPMDLNVEWGKVEWPPKKVVRFGTPVVDEHGNKQGIVIINLYADYLLEQIKKLVDTGGIVFLFDQRGRYLFRYPKDVVNDLPENRNPEFEEVRYKDEFERSILPQLLSGEKGTVKDRRYIISYVPIYTGDNRDFWVLGIKYPLKTLFGSTYTLITYLLFIGVVTIGLSILVAVFMGHYLSVPIQRLKEGVDRIGMKDFRHRVAVKTRDELKDLADHFNDMASKLEDYNHMLTRWNESLKEEVAKRTEELETSRLALLQERDKLKNLIQVAAEGIIIADGRNRVIMANPAAQRILRLEEKDLLGRDLLECHSEPEKVRRVLLEGSQNQFLGIKRWGERILEVSIAVLKDEEGGLTGSMMLFRDVTEAQKMAEVKRELERKIFQAEKLASLSVLSAGIAHEIGNPLAAIKLVVRAMEEELNPSPSHKKYMDRLVREVDRLDEFVKTFGEFAYSHEKKVKQCNIDEILREVIFWTRKEAKKSGISIRYTNGIKDGPSLYVDPYQIQQVFVNLIINAIQATPEGGVIRITTRRVHRPEEGVLISVADTGIGIPEEYLNKIFDPFFTTKPTGTGLGLSVAMKIVREHGGNIEVTSRVKKGTTFRVFLPRTMEGESRGYGTIADHS